MFRPATNNIRIFFRFQLRYIWWLPFETEAYRRERWARLSPEYRSQVERDHQPKLHGVSNLPGASVMGLPGASLSLRQPDEADAVTLREQYYFLKALAVRLDAGRSGTA